MKINDLQRNFVLGNFDTCNKLFTDHEYRRSDLASLDAYIYGILARRDTPIEEPRLVWLCDDSTRWELPWIKELLRGVGSVPELLPRHIDSCRHLILCANRLNQDFSNFVKNKFLDGVDICLFHLSDEMHNDDYSAYNWCYHVYRCQYNRILSRSRNVTTIPLGYKSGFVEGLAGGVDRDIVWSFAGHRRVQSRVDMLDSALGIPGGVVHITSGFNGPEGLNTADYARLMERSWFVPCPAGFFSVDTFRFCESLEAGAIPIYELREGFDYYTEAFGPNPVPKVSSWTELGPLINEIVSQGNVEQVRLQCWRWWTCLKTSLSAHVADIVASRFNARGVVFEGSIS